MDVVRLVPITFEVDTEDEDEAVACVESACFNYLLFCTVEDVNPGRDHVDVRAEAWPDLRKVRLVEACPDRSFPVED